jgi:KUP system potassium uptake protein
MKESFVGAHPLAVDRLHIFGVLSLIFWSLMLIVTSNMCSSQCARTTRAKAARSRCSSLISRHPRRQEVDGGPRYAGRAGDGAFSTATR